MKSEHWQGAAIRAAEGPLAELAARVEDDPELLAAALTDAFAEGIRTCLVQYTAELIELGLDVPTPEFHYRPAMPEPGDDS